MIGPSLPTRSLAKPSGLRSQAPTGGAGRLAPPPTSQKTMRLSSSIGRFAAVKIALAGMMAAMLVACGAPGAGGGPGAATFTQSTAAVKVALLLPVTSSGSTPAVAKALKQAAELALFDFDNPNVSLVHKDTRGALDGARLAAESAIKDGAELIIGPLFAQEVAGAAPVARQVGIPMIAFSSDE